jgi:hypothetical protein
VTALDQFGDPMPTPPTFTWTLDRDGNNANYDLGTISSGLYSASTDPNPLVDCQTPRTFSVAASAEDNLENEIVGEASVLRPQEAYGPYLVDTNPADVPFYRSPLSSPSLSVSLNVTTSGWIPVASPAGAVMQAVGAPAYYWTYISELSQVF